MAHILQGKTITDIKIADDKQAIKFITTEGEVIAKCDGDCCSSTWVESIELPVNGFPATVTSAEDVDMPDLGSPDDYDVIAYYGFKIQTDKGDILIDYRNSSNGYYGGNLYWPKTDPNEDNYYYGGVYGQNESTQQWVDVKDAAVS